ncbi:large subunit ribosomal protein L19, partial [Tremellales sp. Uapishka_1]
MSRSAVTQTMRQLAGIFSKQSLPVASSSRRSMATKVEAATETLSSSSPYPFSGSVVFPFTPSTSTPPSPPLLSPRKGTSVVNHVNTSLLATYDPQQLCKTLFSRRHPKRLTAGAVLTVVSYTNAARSSFSPFSGVLMGIRRRGVDTSFTLRNIVNKTGVELSFKVSSPLIKEIKIVKRADGSKDGLKNLRRAKVNYLRDRPQVMAQIASALKAARV